MFRIKVCGMTRAADVVAARMGDVDAIGMNFYRESPRFLDERQADEIRDAAGDSLQVVGLFVNATADVIGEHCQRYRLDWIQLHGDEPVEMLANLPDRTPILRAFRPRAGEMPAVLEYLNQSQQAGRAPDAILIDAHAPGAYGGTGQRADWELIRHHRDELSAWPLVLAGGLTPQSVAAAIEQVQPRAVDTASGVEQSPGIKSPELMTQFAAAAIGAWNGLA